MQIPEQWPPFIVMNFAKIVNIGLLAFLTWLLLLLIKALSNRLRKRFSAEEFNPDRRARLMTIENVVITTLRAIVIAIAVFTMLGMLGFNLAPLIASAGIAGLAISLGAQSLIKDFIGGFLIVIENQFGLDDFVEIEGVKGTVEAINLRTVSLRDYTGKLHIVPNGDIRILSNYSRDWIRSIVDLNIPFDADVGAVVEALEETLAALDRNEIARSLLLEPPVVSGWNSQSEWGVQVRMTARVKVGEQYTIEKLFRQYALESLRKRDIHLAVPGQDILIQRITDAESE